MQKFINFIYEIPDLYNFLNFIPKSILYSGDFIVYKNLDNGATIFQKVMDKNYSNVDNLINGLPKSPKFQLNFS